MFMLFNWSSLGLPSLWGTDLELRALQLLLGGLQRRCNTIICPLLNLP